MSEWMIPAFLLLLAFLGSVGGVWWLRWAIKRQFAGTAEPVCGACRYPVRGLSRLECPECGADLREAGIISPALDARFAPGAPFLIAIWTIVVVLGGGLLMVLGESVLPEHAVFTHTYRYTPDSGSLRSIDISLNGDTYDGSRRPDTATVLLTGQDGAQATASLSRIHWDEGAQTVLAAKAASIGVTHPELAPDLADLSAFLGDVGADGILNSLPARLTGGMAASSTSVSMPLNFLALLVVALALVWIFGIWRLVRLRKRALTRPSTVPARV